MANEAMTDSVRILDALNNPSNIQGDISALSRVFKDDNRRPHVDNLRPYVAGLARDGLRIIYMLEAGEGTGNFTVYSLMVLPETVAGITSECIAQSVDDLKSFLEKNMPQDGSAPPFDGAEAIRTMLVMELIRISSPNFDAKSPVPEKRKPVQAAIDRTIPAGNVLVLSCLEDQRGICLQYGYLLDGNEPQSLDW